MTTRNSSPNPNRPKSFAEAAKSMKLTPSEEAELDGQPGSDDRTEAPAPPQPEAVAPPVSPDDDGEYDLPDADGAPPPEWVIVPPRMKFPQELPVTFFMFKSQWTDKPSKGDRQCILWGLNVADERLALARTAGDPLQSLKELAKQTIRSIDGVQADWTGRQGIGNVNTFWNEIGPKCRQVIQNYYLKTHAMTDEEKLDFFANCVAVRTASNG